MPSMSSCHLVTFVINCEEAIESAGCNCRNRPVFQRLDRPPLLLWAVACHMLLAACPTFALRHWQHGLGTHSFVMFAATIGASLGLSSPAFPSRPPLISILSPSRSNFLAAVFLERGDELLGVGHALERCHIDPVHILGEPAVHLWGLVVNTMDSTVRPLDVENSRRAADHYISEFRETHLDVARIPE